MAAVAWVLTAVFYFYQYALRSAPAVMMPQLSDAFGLSAFPYFVAADAQGNVVARTSGEITTDQFAALAQLTLGNR